MHRNVWQYLFSVSPKKKNCALKLTPKETEKRSNPLWSSAENGLFFGDEKAFTEGSLGNGFKSDQKSHNNQNLLNDLLAWLHGLKTRKIFYYFFWQNKREKIRLKKEFTFFEEIKSEQGLESDSPEFVEGLMGFGSGIKYDVAFESWWNSMQVT